MGARIRDGQLDQSPLTLDDLHRIKSEFAKTLTSFYHQRVEYPDSAWKPAAPASAVAAEADGRSKPGAPVAGPAEMGAAGTSGASVETTGGGEAGARAD
ncbi:MAG: hypothetical protein P8Y10_07780 [Gemmatimonadales bacterium]